MSVCRSMRCWSLVAVFLLWTVHNALGRKELVSKTPYASSDPNDKYNTELILSNATMHNASPLHLEYLGGDAQSRPCCVSWGPGRVDCFVRGLQSNVLHITITKNKDGKREYTGWENLKGEILNDVTCVSRDVGIIDLLALGHDHKLLVNSYGSDGWTGWKSKGGKFVEVPSCASRDTLSVNCMLRDTTDAVYHFRWENGAWQDLEDLRLSVKGPLGCVSRRQKRFNCFGAGPNGHLLQKYWVRGWRGSEDLGGRVKGRPSLTAWSKGHMDVFGLDPEGHVWQKTFDKGEWKKSVSLGGSFDSPPECISTGVGQIYCFAIGHDSTLVTNSLNGGYWAGWTATRGPFIAPPSCLMTDENELSCYGRDVDKNVYEFVFDVSTTAAQSTH